MALRIGITGGIGSGKTTACQVFATLGIPVFYADLQARRLMQEDPFLVTGIRNLLGEDAYGSDGQLDRPLVAERVFGNTALLQKLNALVHPAVGRHGQEWHRQQEEVPYTLYEAALLFESGGHREMDRIIVVTAPEEVRLQRVMTRDGATEAEVRARMARQLPQAEKEERADFLIHNDGQQLLLPQVIEIHRQLLGQAAGAV